MKPSLQKRRIAAKETDRKREQEAIARLKAASELEQRAAGIGHTIATMEHERLSLLTQAAVLRMTWQEVDR